MPRYIDADELLKKLLYGNTDSIVLRSYAIEFVKSMPTADVSPASKVKQLNHDIESLRNEINSLKKYDAERDIKLHAGLILRTEEKIASELSSEIGRYFNKEISFYKDQHFTASLGYDKERCRYCEYLIEKLEQHKQHFTELLKKYIGEQNDGRN